MDDDASPAEIMKRALRQKDRLARQHWTAITIFAVTCATLIALAFFAAYDRSMVAAVVLCTIVAIIFVPRRAFTAGCFCVQIVFAIYQTVLAITSTTEATRNGHFFAMAVAAFVAGWFIEQYRKEGNQ